MGYRFHALNINEYWINWKEDTIHKVPQSKKVITLLLSVANIIT